MGIPIPRFATNIMRKSFHALMPEKIKKSRFVNKVIVRTFMGKYIDIDWKKKFKNISDEEWSRIYDRSHIEGFRDDDTSPLQKNEILKSIYGNKILEVGPGTGHLTVLMAKKGYDVTAADCSKVALKKCLDRAKSHRVNIKTKQAFLEKLPFKTKNFDTVICAHTLEHVKDLESSIKELKRVAKKRVIVIVPEQEYEEYTTDLHTFFFPNKQSLIKAMGMKKYTCIKLAEDLFYVGHVST